MLLLLHKPKGVSSFFALRTAQKKLSQILGKKIKMGHAGTLDPLATGLLLSAVGSGTKALSELILEKKTYRATLFLGKFSTTDDDEGEKYLPEYETKSSVSAEEFLAVLKSFEGGYEQIPPVYSALKKDGKRVCDRVRSGEEIDMTEKKRMVKIFSVELENFSFPFATFSVSCGSGTYIRSLARDIGNRLQTGAYLSDLCRTHIGDFSLENAILPENVMPENLFAFSPEHFALPSFFATESEKKTLFFGQKITRTAPDAEKISLFESTTQKFFGFGEQKDGVLKAKSLLGET